MLDRVSLTVALNALAAEGRFFGLDGYAFRSIALRHFLPPRLPSPLYAASSGLIGTRFVPPSLPIQSLYLALDAETVHREGNQAHYQSRRIPGLAPQDVSPADEVVVIGIRLRLSAMLDVTSDLTRQRLGTTSDELRARWKSVIDAPTQRLGEAVYENGLFEGIVYDSAQHPGFACLVVFPNRLRPGSFVEFKSRTPGVPDARLTGPAT